MQVEHVARVGLTSGRPPKQQGDRSIGVGLFGQVVIDHEGVLPLLHPVGPHGGPRVWGDVAERRRVRGRGVHHHRVLERAGVVQRLDHLGDRRCLLADGHVDALHLALGVATRPVVALVDDGVDGDGGLPRLPVADDQLALATADRRHGVDGLDAGLERFLHRLAVDHRGRLDLQDAGLLGPDGSPAVDRLAQGVDDAPQHPVADRHRQDAAGPLDGVALLDVGGLAQDHASDLVLFEVQRQAEHPAGELQQLVRHGRWEPGHPGDPVARHHDSAHLFALHGGFEALDVFPEGLPDLLR
jgi:hypothetical protein